MEEHGLSQYCFQDRNSSCRKSSISTQIYLTIYIFFAFISTVTVFLNLLVIISISTNKQLHSPTNLLIVSLAVSDLLIGLFVIPAMTVAIMEPCWVFGEYFCVLLLYITFLSESSSVGNLILISIDRYVAVCDPLLYNIKITIKKTRRFIFISWICCIIYDAVVVKLYVNLRIPIGCFEECDLFEEHIWADILDCVISVFVPCTIIVTLYLKIFLVARSQARQVFSKKAEQANKSERKAARTLGIVVFNFLLFWNPIVSILLMFSNYSLAAFIVIFLPLLNSFINPIIYAFFYPWFKATAKHIFTLKIRSL